jgi:hypothetical protein
MLCEWRTVELLDGLQNWAEKEQGEAGQSTHARRELGTVCSKIKPQGGRELWRKTICFGAEKNCVSTEKFLYYKNILYLC